MDKDLNDDMLKLVRYKILYVKRDEETSYDAKDELVHDNLDAGAYTAWKIAEFTKTAEGQQYSQEDQKYLRVFYEVLERYPREKFKYEEDQIAILTKIEKK